MEKDETETEHASSVEAPSIEVRELRERRTCRCWVLLNIIIKEV